MFNSSLNIRIILLLNFNRVYFYDITYYQVTLLSKAFLWSDIVFPVEYIG